MSRNRHYEIVSHSELGDLASRIYDLTAACFAAYPGVIQPMEAHRAWYVRRPGMDTTLSSAALYGGEIVSSVFITRVTMRLGGDLMPVGMVDTVMTHPAHRRRGLASAVLSRAILGMKSEGLAAAALSTLLGSMPYDFYKRLGFRLVTPMDYYQRAQPAGGHLNDRAEALLPETDAQARDFLNAYFAPYDGYIPYDEALWRWRKRERPPELPAEHRLARDGQGEIIAFVSLCHAPIIAQNGAQAVTILTDLALPKDCDRTAQMFEALLAPIPVGQPVGALVPRCNEDEVRLFRAQGFQPIHTEAMMVLPFWPALDAVLERSPDRWYPVVESVIGV